MIGIIYVEIIKRVNLVVGVIFLGGLIFFFLGGSEFG